MFQGDNNLTVKQILKDKQTFLTIFFFLGTDNTMIWHK